MTLFNISQKLLLLSLWTAPLCLSAQWAPFGSSMPAYVIGFETHDGDLFAFSQPSPYAYRWTGSDWDTLPAKVPAASGIHMLKSMNDSLFALPYATQAENRVYIRHNGAWEPLGGTFKNVSSTLPPNLYDIIQYNNEIYVSGEFNRVDDDTISGIARWNGSEWTAVGTGFTTGMAPIPNVMYPHQLSVYNNRLVVVGNFLQAGGATVNGIAAWDGQQWSGFGDGFNRVAYGVEVYNGELYVGGEFTHAGTVNAAYAAKWNGSAWTDAGFGFSKVSMPGNVFIHTLKAIGGKLYVAGGYNRVTSASGTHKAGGIVRFDGTSVDTLAGGTNGDTEAILLYQGGILAGGGFNLAGSTAVHNVALWTNTAGISGNTAPDALLVYPSPAADQLFLQNIPARATRYQIISADGHCLGNGKIQTEIPVAGLRKGIYFIQVLDGHSVMEIRKFVKW